MAQDEEMKDRPTPSQSISTPIPSTLQRNYILLKSKPFSLTPIFFAFRFEGNSIDH